MNREIVLENRLCRLVVGEDCIVQSLTVKSTGEECLRQNEDVALFSVTQERPYNNEVKLIHPCRRIVCQGNRLRREGNRLIVGFEIVPVEAVIEVEERDSFISFTLTGFNVRPEHYDYLKMHKPPVAELRLIQLPVANRGHFGEWLNASWDEQAAVCVMAVSPYAIVGSERRKGWRLMSADVQRDLKLKNAGTALVACAGNELMDAIDSMERECGLPLGVQSRRGPMINASAYHSGDITPVNVDEHIRYAKMAGYRLMLIYYTSIFREERGYSLIGNYDYRPEYPEGPKDLKRMLEKIKAAGITPGIHFLHTHIGLRSRYVTPAPDYRLNLSRKFTLSAPVGLEDDVIPVENNPEDTVLEDGCRILKFGSELISYEGYTDEPPYCFTGCVRGALDTIPSNHPAGEIGGLLDICEFGATSTYLDQNTSLQEEIGAKLAEAYNCGFEFVYFDGSEGAKAPFDVHIPNAQYRVYRMFDRAPIFTEGAAKAHFSWHYLSGGNAFDVFPPPVFKRMIDRFPLEEAPRMREDFTRLNFGWWGYWTPGERSETEPGTQPDMLEYGTSRAAAWDCPATLLTSLEKYAAHPRTPDNLEVIRRWEEVRATNWLTEDQKKELRKPGKEYHLLINEKKEFELVAGRMITGEEPGVRAVGFERGDCGWVVCWHTFGEGVLELPIPASEVEVRKELFENPVSVDGNEHCVRFPVAGRTYLRTNLSLDALEKAFDGAVLL